MPTSSIRDLDAEPLQRGDTSPRFGEILDRLALGHLEHDLRQLQRRLVENLANVVDDLLVGEMASGQVEAELQMRRAPITAPAS